MSKFVKVGSAWAKTTKNGDRNFISISTKSKDLDYFVDKNPKTGNTQTRLFVQVGDNEPVQVSNLSLFENDIDFDKYPSAPNYSLTFSLDD